MPGTIKAGEKARANLEKTKSPVWSNVDYLYNKFSSLFGHNTALAMLGSVILESLADPNKKLKNGSGKGLLLWNNPPKGLEAQADSMIRSVRNPVNAYNKTTKISDNYWAPYNGMNGRQARDKFIGNNTSLDDKVKIYTKSLVRPGDVAMNNRLLFAHQLDSIYNPNIKDKLVYYKNGGVLQFLKNGSGIHIKKANRGKFTDYCGGKVTSACIAKGKASPNPAIRKRATFADNARHFKHRSGGLIILEFKLKRKLNSIINN